MMFNKRELEILNEALENWAVKEDSRRDMDGKRTFSEAPAEAFNLWQRISTGMKLYVAVCSWDHEGGKILGAFDTPEAAKRCLDLDDTDCDEKCIEVLTLNKKGGFYV